MPALLSSLSVLLVLFAVVLHFEWRSIEQDIADTSRLLLEKGGLTWANVTTHNRGRDVLLHGNAPNAIAVEQATNLLETNPAIRRIDFAGMILNSIQTRAEGSDGPAENETRATNTIQQAPAKTDTISSRLKAQVNGDILIISGTLPDSPASSDYITQLIAKAIKIFGQNKVLNQINLSSSISGVPASIADGILETLQTTPFVDAQFAQEHAGFVLEGDSLVLTGVVKDHIQRQSYEDRISELFAGEISNLVATIDPTGKPALRIFNAEEDQQCAAQILSLLSESRITFEEGKALVKPESHSLLERLSVLIKRCPDSQFNVVGHTDDTGNSNSNLRLSADRAESVKQYLLYLGVSAHHLLVKGVGATQPLTSESTEAGRALNRRVEFHLIERADSATKR